MRRPTIILQNVDRSHCRYLTESEAAQMKTSGVVITVVAKHGKQTLRLKPHVKPSESKESATCITLADMLANAGMGSPSAIFRARVKVKAFHPKQHGAAVMLRSRANAATATSGA